MQDFKTPTFSAPIIARPQPMSAFGTKTGGSSPRGVGGPRMMGSFKKGGKIKKTGLYRVHKGEVIVPSGKTVDDVLREYRERTAAEALGKKFDPPHKIIVDQNDDGSFSITHQYRQTGDEPAKKDRKFSARNKNALSRHVKQVYGQ
jgi:hypothetical protein